MNSSNALNLKIVNRICSSALRSLQGLYHVINVSFVYWLKSIDYIQCNSLETLERTKDSMVEPIMVLAYMMGLVGHPTIGASIWELQRLRMSPGRIKSL